MSLKDEQEKLNELDRECDNVDEETVTEFDIENCTSGS